MVYIGYQGYHFYLDLKVMKEKHPKLTYAERRDLSHFRGNVLFQDYAIRGPRYPLTLFSPIVMHLKLLLLCLLILSNDTQTQLTCSMLLNLSTMTFVLLVHPFKSNVKNAQLIFNEMALFLLYMQAHQFIPKIVVKPSDNKFMT